MNFIIIIINLWQKKNSNNSETREREKDSIFIS
jgi:hypothetical protein